MWAVLPVKDLGHVKTRLAPGLSLPERVGLFRCMIQDVMAAVTAVPLIDGLLVVTRDPEIRPLAKSFGADVLEEARDDGLNGAVKRAAHWLCQRGETGLLHIPGDIPTVTSDELSRVLAAHRTPRRTHGSLTIVPCRKYDGSNCILCTPPDRMPFAFGKDSFRRHIAAARDLGITVQIMEEPGIALDIDDLQDLAKLAAMPCATRTHRFLRDSGIGRRVLDAVDPRESRMIA